MKVALGQIFRLAILQAREKIINSGRDFSEDSDDGTLQILADNIETYRQIKELARFFEQYSNVPFEEVLFGYFEEEDNR